LNAQTDEQIINEILFDLFVLQHDTILIENLKTRTYFEYDSASFENLTGLTVPSKIISEWKNNEEKEDFSSVWNELNLNKIDTLFLENDTVICKNPVFKCLKKLGLTYYLSRLKNDKKYIQQAKYYSITQKKMQYFILR